MRILRIPQYSSSVCFKLNFRSLQTLVTVSGLPRVSGVEYRDLRF